MANFFQLRKKINAFLYKKHNSFVYGFDISNHWFNVKCSVIVSYFEKWTSAKVSSRSGMLAFDGE